MEKIGQDGGCGLPSCPVFRVWHDAVDFFQFILFTIPPKFEKKIFLYEGTTIFRYATLMFK